MESLHPRVDGALALLRARAGPFHCLAPVPGLRRTARRARDSVGDLDGYLADAAERSPFMQVRRQLARRLAEPRH
jgi:hypothetical protein